MYARMSDACSSAASDCTEAESAGAKAVAQRTSFADVDVEIPSHLRAQGAYPRHQFYPGDPERTREARVGDHSSQIRSGAHF